MAGETTTNSISSNLQTDIAAVLIPEIRENAIMVPLTDFDLLDAGTSAYSFQRNTTSLSLAAITSGANEADAQSATTVSTAGVTVTPAMKAAFILSSWLAERTSKANWDVELAGMLARAAADAMDVDAAALLGGASNTVGTSGVDCSLEVLRQAILKLRTVAKGAAAMGAAFVLHPQQVDDVDAELQTGGAGLTTLMSRSDVINWYGEEPGSGMLTNFRGGLMGIPVFTSTNVPDANVAADHAGALFVLGQFIGGRAAWLPEMVQASAISNLKVANVRAVVAAYAFAERQDAKGISVITDHA